MWRGIANLAGFVIVALVLSQIPLVLFFRFDDEEEYLWVLRLDVKIGTLLAFGLFLIGIPQAGRNTKRWRIVWLSVVFLSWLCMSGGLAWTHYEAYRFRSGY